jgi:hypothetical protein
MAAMIGIVEVQNWVREDYIIQSESQLIVDCICHKKSCPKGHADPILSWIENLSRYFD